MRFFIIKPSFTPILYKLYETTSSDDIDVITLLPIAENFSKEYDENKDIIIIAHNKQTKEYGYFPDNKFISDINIRELDFNDIEQFIYYITESNVKIVKWYLEAEIDVNRIDRFGNYPIMYVKDFYILKMMINSNAKINTIHTHSDTEFKQPIYYFIIDNFQFQFYIVKYLLKHGLDVNLVDTDECNFLYRVVDYNIHEIFIKYGLKIDPKLKEYYHKENFSARFLTLFERSI